MNDADEMVIPQQLRLMQIIAAALLTGCIVFLAICLYLVSNNQGQGMAGARDRFAVSLMAALMLAACAPLAFILPRFIMLAHLRRIAAGTWQAPRGAKPEQFATFPAKLMAVGLTTMLIGLAMLEGPVFLGCIAYLLEGQALALAVVGVGIFLMLVKFPTKNRVRDWLVRQTDRLAEFQKS